MNALKNLDDLFKEVKRVLKKIKDSDKICIVHHDDADGCCSAALFSILIHNMIDDYPILFPIIGVENINKRLINELKTLSPEYVFVLDVTAEPIELNPFKGFILDHHIFFDFEKREDMSYLNPRIFEKTDEKVPPTSCMSYRVLNDLFPTEKVAWIAGIGITEDHRVELCKDVFEKIKKENPELLKVNIINQKNMEKSFFGELWDMVRSGRMVKGSRGARTAVLALIECKDRPDKFVNGLTQHSLALRRFYEKLAYETENLLRDVEKRAKFFKREKMIVYEQRRMKLRGLTSFLSDKIRQRYPEWISYVVIKDYGGRKAKISIRLEQSRREENLVAMIEKIKEKIPNLKGGGHKTAVGVVLDSDDVIRFEEEFLNLLR